MTTTRDLRTGQDLLALFRVGPLPSGQHLSPVILGQGKRQCNDPRDHSSHHEQGNLQRRDIHYPSQHRMLGKKAGIPNGGDGSDRPTRTAIRNPRIECFLVDGPTSRANDSRRLPTSRCPQHVLGL